MKFDELLNMTKEIYNETLHPIILTDDKLEVRWVNAVTLERFPMFSLSDSLKRFLHYYNIDNILSSLKSGGTFLANDATEPLSEISIKLIPIISDGVLIGCHAFLRYNALKEGEFKQEAQINIGKAISNELKMPLTLIFSSLGIIEQRLEALHDVEGISYIKLINQNCYRLLRVSENLTTFYDFRSGIVKLNLVMGDLRGFIAGMCDACAILTATIGIPLEYSIPETPLMTVFDPDKISAAFFNIISNSCRYTREGNSILVKLTERSGMAMIKVIDKGMGIEGEFLNSIFDPYFSQRDDEEIQGTGLGLAILKDVVMKHHGTVAVHSEKNMGTSIAFTLPIKTEGKFPLYAAENGDNYLANRFSPMYVEMSDVCGTPLP